MSKNLIGNVFGRLTVIVQAESMRMPSGALKRMWQCRCECGDFAVCQQQHLTGGRSKSCGCLHREMARAASTKHGGRYHPLYDIWTQMIQRCENPRNPAYRDYGGRGIYVCERWRSDFNAFLCDVGERPTGHSLDRYPNNDGPYSPDNFRWATPKQQVANSRPRRKLAYCTVGAA